MPYIFCLRYFWAEKESTYFRRFDLKTDSPKCTSVDFKAAMRNLKTATYQIAWF